MSTQITDELRVLVEAEVEKAIKEMEKLDKAIGETEKEAKDLDDALGKLEKGALVLSGIIIAAGTASVKFAAENEKLKKSLENVLGSANDANEVFEEWRKLGTSPGLSVEEVFTLGKSLVSLGNNAEYVTKTMKVMGNIAAGTGSSFQAISGVYEKVRAQGQLTMRDLNQMQQQGIPIITELSKTLQTSDADIKNLVSQGKVGFQELEAAFTGMTATTGKYAGAMDTLSGTTMEKFSNVTDDAKQALASFGELLLPMVNDILDFASGALNALENMDDGTKRFVLGMGGVVAISGPVILAIKGINAAMNANPIVLAISGVIAGVSLFVGLLAAAKTEADKFAAANKAAKTHADSLLNSYGGLNGAKTLDQKTTVELISLYPELNKQIKAYGTTVDEARRQIERVNLLRNATDHNEYNRILVETANTFEETGGRIRGLTKNMFDAAKETGHFSEALQEAARGNALEQKLRGLQAMSADTVVMLEGDAKRILSILEQEINPDATTWWEGPKDANEKIVEALDLLDYNARQLEARLTETAGWAEAVANKDIDAMISILKSFKGDDPRVTGEAQRIREEINKIVFGITIKTDPPPVKAADKKRWQEWYSEITRVDLKQFDGFKEQGKTAAELFVKGLEGSLSVTQTVSDALGASFDVAGVLRGQQNEIQKAITDLLSIDPKNIDDPFKLMDESIKPLIETYNALGEAIQGDDYTKTIEALQKKIRDLGKSEKELAYETMMANKYKKEEADKVKELMDEYDRTVILDEYRQRVEALGLSQEELARLTLVAANATEEELAAFDKMVKTIKAADISGNFQAMFTGWLEDALGELGSFDKAVSKVLADLAYGLANISMNGVLSGLEEIGSALAQNADAGDAMKNALASMSMQLLEALPNLFLQAGLQMIATPGMWPLGLGLIAAAGATSLINGYVKGSIQREQNAVSQAAASESLAAGPDIMPDTALLPYAHGGAFTNQIVSTPTYFRYGAALGVMGEAGDEAVIPLKRM
ncbi:MAG: tape measure protein, partial [Treponema sp.]|nr:tape measure protein [Treponema sp.]